MGVTHRFIATEAALVATLVACGGGGSPPELAPIADQQVAVGAELVIELLGTDPDGDDLSYDFQADVPDIHSRATVTQRPDGSGMFRWTPLAADVGPWFFDFSVSDGDHTETVTIQIEVKSAIGVNSAPVFREPLGTGTTLDLTQRTCLDLDIVVEDQDSTSVVIAQEETFIDGATVTASGGLSATWHWCPTAEQIAADDRYTLTLSADDLTNSKTIKHYLIVLRKAPKPDCPGDAPVINHTPTDESTLVGLTIDAQISDDQGLKAEPLLYYSLSSPTTPPDLSSMTQVSMLLISGSMQSGTWAADVPNPVANLNMGDMRTVYYVIVAQDDDDAAGDCDHVTQAPATGSYDMTVTNPGGNGGAGLCEACTQDIQCGDADDNCVRVGTGGDSFCLTSCSSNADCPTDYTCSTTAVTSVNNASARQCVPISNDCSNPGGQLCADDSYEDNDSRTQASSRPELPPGDYDLTSCPASVGDDEDWYRIVLTADAQVAVDIVGGTASDLDLSLYDSTGSLVQSATNGSGSSESISMCLTAGTYYVRVYAWSPVENEYLMSYTRTAQSCAATCQPDANEPDDNATEATQLGYDDIYPDSYLSIDDTLCTLDDDWFRISELIDGDRVVVDLYFTQTTSNQDLDLHWYRNGTDLTPCSKSDPLSCSSANGQSADSDEHAEYVVSNPACTISAPCIYYVVVRGWDGSENDYDIEMLLEPAP